MHVLNILLTAAAIVLLIPTAVFCLECLLSLLPRRRAKQADQPRPSIAVLMPAHDEAAGIGPSIESVLAQLQPSDRLVVIADNCTDNTADVARALGATVFERTDVTRRGKGFALAFGVRHLEQQPPDVVLIMDADCLAEPGMVELVARQAAATARPAQAIYLMEQPPKPGVRDLVSALAFQVKNEVRPSGLSRIGLPCLLTGTGMAFPWKDLASANLATGNIVEDMQLGIDLTLARRAPRFCPAARVTGRLPANQQAIVTQRRRWEHGHLRTLMTQVPPLLGHAVTRFDIGAAAIALDLAVPPLSLLVATIGAAAFLATAAALLGASAIPAILLASGFAAIGLCVVLAWASVARKRIPLRTLVAIPVYVLWKLPIYLSFLVRQQRTWQRTDRSQPHVGPRRPNRGGRRRQLTAAPKRPTVTLANIAVDAVTERECVDRILKQLEQGHGGVVITPNMDHLHRCTRDPEYATMLTAADIVVPDGMPLVWASKLQGTPLPARVAGSDLISSLTAAAAACGRTVFLLGGAPGTADASAKVLLERNPNLKLAGVHCPPMGFENDAEVLPDLIEALRLATPDIVFVGLGSPKQEKLISVLRERFPTTWWLGVGYSFSFLSGEASRAPMWMQKRGLEWLHRLSQDPRRLAKRYLVDNLPFAASLISRAVISGLAKRVRPDAPVIEDEAAELALSSTNTDIPLPAYSDSKVVYQSYLSEPLSRSVAARVAAIRSERRVRPIESNSSLTRLRGVVILAGSAGPNSLGSVIDRSILDLPLHDGNSLLSHWHRQVRDLRRSIGVAKLPMVIMVDRKGMIPIPPPRLAHVPITIQRDRMAYRGTGGVLRDFAMEYDANDYLLIATAGQSLIRPLADQCESLAERSPDVSFISPVDGSPSGLMLVRCAALQSIARAGYVDFKEQALPSLARHYDVTPVRQAFPGAMPVRSLTEYLAVMQYHHRQRTLATQTAGTFDEEQSPAFAVVEQGAVVHPTAVIHDSVVLRNARVDADAVVVRSIVCPGGVIRENATALDKVVLSRGAA